METACCAAVALGWQMAELYDDSLRRNADKITTTGEVGVSPGAESPKRKDLPGTGRLEPGEKLQLRLAQIEEGVQKLGACMGDKRFDDLLAEMRQLFKNARELQLEENEHAAELIADAELPNKLRAVHVNLLSALTVVDFRLGKAYGLGRALGDVCRRLQTDEELEWHLAPQRMNKLISWCSDLKTVLPDHAGQAVAGSLRRWRSWARNHPWKTVDRKEFDQRLRRQGERWRSVLTGEKAARDLLTPQTYIQAGEQLLANAAQMAWGFAKKFSVALLAAGLLLGGGIYILLQGANGGNIVGGLTAIAASLGITWKTATPTLTNLAQELADPLWGAELDAAITTAVTDPLVPAGGDALIEVTELNPPPVGQAADRRLMRTAGRQVWKRLDRTTKARALAGESSLKRLSYRRPAFLSRRSGSPFMPRDAYLSNVQSMLEKRIAGKRLETSAVTEDELSGQFGPNDWEWIKSGVQACLTWLGGTRHAFGTKPEERKMSDRALVILFGDWATGTPRARRLAQEIRKRLEEASGDRECHLIHLGDVYYSGLPDEYQSRFLEWWPAAGLKDVTSWNLNGNHDMYSGGNAYFELISGDKDTLGAGAEMFGHQEGTSFFRLLNRSWQIIGLDTAYVDKDLASLQETKLKEWVEVDDTGRVKGPSERRTILLSHHQLGSAMAQASVGSGIRKKTEAIRKSGRIHAWFWGHEHRYFRYEEYLHVKCPVCIGNGGVPELRSRGIFTFSGAFQAISSLLSRVFARVSHPRVGAPRVAEMPLPDEDSDGLKWEQLGFVVLELDGRNGKATYVDEHGNESAIASFGD